ncbi:MAG: hypothetical protein K6A42_11110 [Treponema sp.]|nr:hypothetical protein [Treponema sp.]
MDESQRQQFLTSFSERVNDIVVEMKMVELIAPARAFSEMNLIPQSRNSLWGLIVVCSHSLYFYVPSREQALFSMINVSANAKNFEEQIFCFNNADGLQFKLPKRSWFKFFGPEKIIFSFISNGHEIGGFFNVSKDAQKILDSMLKAYRS